MKNAKILIFEDKSGLIEIYEKVFNSSGFEVKVFNKYEKPYVVDIVVEEKPDIIYCDILMPGMDGLTATELLKKDERTKDIPIIVVGNMPVKKAMEKSLKAGAIFYCCTADYTSNQLVDVFKKFLSYKSQWERYTNGYIVNSLRNNEMVNKLNKRYKKLGLSALEILDIYFNILGRSEYLDFSLHGLFDPRNPNWFATSKEGAIEGMRRSAYINELDRKYLEEKFTENLYIRNK